MGIGIGGSHGTRLLEHEDSLRQLAPPSLLRAPCARDPVEWSAVVAREVVGGVGGSGSFVSTFKWWQRKLKRDRRGEAPTEDAEPRQRQAVM